MDAQDQITEKFPNERIGAEADEFMPKLLMIAERGSIRSKLPDYIDLVEYEPGKPTPIVIQRSY